LDSSGFYRMIASLISERWAEDAQSSFSSLLREELNANRNGLH